MCRLRFQQVIGVVSVAELSACDSQTTDCSLGEERDRRAAMICIVACGLRSQNPHPVSPKNGETRVGHLALACAHKGPGRWVSGLKAVTKRRLASATIPRLRAGIHGASRGFALHEPVGMRYGFVIDNRKCIGCHACTVACKTENHVPLTVNRTWVKYVEKGIFPIRAACSRSRAATIARIRLA